MHIFRSRLGHDRTVRGGGRGRGWGILEYICPPGHSDSQMGKAKDGDAGIKKTNKCFSALERDNFGCKSSML